MAYEILFCGLSDIILWLMRYYSLAYEILFCHYVDLSAG